MLKMQITELKQELAFYKGDNKTKEKSKIDISDTGISRDITAQKEYEEKLAYQAKILSNVKDAIIVVDENNIIKYCNRALEKLFGWKKQELIGYLFFDFVQCCVDKESKRRSILALDGIRRNYNTEDKNQLNEIKCYTKDGTQIITDIYITVVRDSKGQFKGLISSIRDVSKRYEYEQKLKKSEKKYRYLFNSIDEGYAIIDVIFDKENKAEDLRYVELNKAYEKQTGLINNKIKGKTAKELKYQIEDIWYETYGMVAKTGESIRLVNKVKRLNRWFDVYIFKIDLEKCNQVGVLFKDVTEEVLYNHKLEELIKIQDELYLNVSHELKTPLNVIFSANQLMDLSIMRFSKR